MHLPSLNGNRMPITHPAVGICEDVLHLHWHVNGCACLIQATILLKACAVTSLLYLEDAIILSSFWYPGLQYIQFN